MDGGWVDGWMVDGWMDGWVDETRRGEGSHFCCFSSFFFSLLFWEVELTLGSSLLTLSLVPPSALVSRAFCLYWRPFCAELGWGPKRRRLKKQEFTWCSL